MAGLPLAGFCAYLRWWVRAYDAEEGVAVRVYVSNCRQWLFVQIAPGFWIRTHPCVEHYMCPRCGAIQGRPCTGLGDLPTGGTHHVRRKAWKADRGG